MSFGKQVKWVIVSALLVVVIAIGIGFHQHIKNQLNAWKLLPEPERLTELYFTHPNNLPSTYTPGQDQTVSFTAHNIEYRTVTYSYKINESSQNAAHTKLLSSGSFTLQQNQYKTIALPVVPANLGARIKVTAALPTVNESVDYWVNRSGA
jgi:uncharacterized membrane protein